MTEPVANSTTTQSSPPNPPRREASRSDGEYDPLTATRRLVVSALAPGGWGRRFAKLWGFLGFCIFVLVLARAVVLPFVFALLIAYILAPVVRHLSTGKNGKRRMPRSAAVIICYVVILGAIGLFVGALLPRLTTDVARVGAEAPAVYKKFNDEWAPAAAAWIGEQIPAVPTTVAPAEVVAADPALPPGTHAVITPLPDGRFAISLDRVGLEVRASGKHGYVIAPSSKSAADDSLEDKLRTQVKEVMTQVQSQIGGLFKFGKAVIQALLKSIFSVVLVLMVAAFVLLDLERINAFVRSLVPLGYRGDYDVIVGGIDHGLNGVIRGQLLICLINGVLTWVGLLLFSVKYAFLLATVAAVLSLVPIFGSILSSVPIVISALASSDSGVDLARGLSILLWIIGIHLIEANLLNPRIIGTSAKIHPVLVVFALVFGEQAYGLTGALLAVPVLSIVQVMFMFFRSKAWKTEGPKLPSAPVAAP